MARVGGKERLLESAQAEFAESSYDRVGVAQVLARAGVQAPTLYHHFGDKEGLYLSWATTKLEGLEASLAPAANPALGLQAALELYSSALLANLDFDLRQVMKDGAALARQESREQAHAAYLQSAYGPLYSVLVKAMTRGDLQPGPVALLAETFLAGLLALARQNKRTPEVGAWWSRTFLAGALKHN
ncbi:MAG: TetR/AcrR family transcriptional regulator [Fimbriimonas ginsengisoli]|uniref:TetR/AcrR family transcriptional regulator n=1 Tax=Fimbriimonas ginsengisoli TaxID=1005039 RepID=A0A931LQQ8_FIMGI|nr:TetR/AcrR family transcriptional regulator [Fimbriimonas ginsengisoli]